MKGEDSEWGREYWLTCNTESGGGRDPANIKYIITFILISLLAPVYLLARLAVAMAPSEERVQTSVLPLVLLLSFFIANLDFYCRHLKHIVSTLRKLRDESTNSSRNNFATTSLCQ